MSESGGLAALAATDDDERGVGDQQQWLHSCTPDRKEM